MFALVVAAAIGAWLATSASPFESESGLNYNAPLAAGEDMTLRLIPHRQGVNESSPIEGITLRSAEVVGGGLDSGGVTVTAVVVCASMDQGLVPGGRETLCLAPREVGGATLTDSHPVIAAVLTAQQPGVHRIDGIRLSFRDGLRWGTQLLEADICLAVGEHRAEADINEC